MREIISTQSYTSVFFESHLVVRFLASSVDTLRRPCLSALPSKRIDADGLAASVPAATPTFSLCEVCAALRFTSGEDATPVSGGADEEAAASSRVFWRDSRRCRTYNAEPVYGAKPPSIGYGEARGQEWTRDRGVKCCKGSFRRLPRAPNVIPHEKTVVTKWETGDRCTL